MSRCHHQLLPKHHLKKDVKKNSKNVSGRSKGTCCWTSFLRKGCWFAAHGACHSSPGRHSKSFANSKWSGLKLSVQVRTLRRKLWTKELKFICLLWIRNPEKCSIVTCLVAYSMFSSSVFFTFCSNLSFLRLVARKSELPEVSTREEALHRLQSSRRFFFLRNTRMTWLSCFNMF